MDKKRGTVKFFDRNKGYGFIHYAGEDYYFNVQNIIGAELPANGATVEFIEREGRKGPSPIASDVTILQNATFDSSKANDSRVICPHCNKKMVPRLVTYRGEPDKSLCPFCGEVYKKFSDSKVWIFIAAGIVIWIILGWAS